MTTPQTLQLKDIVVDEEIQARVEVDELVAGGYASAMERGDKFPDLVVFYDGIIYWLACGFHRLLALVGLGRSEVDCEVIKGTRDDAQWYAIGCNKSHGLRRSNADKTKAVKAALKHPNGVEMSDTAIAEHVGVDHKTVAKYRDKLESTRELPKSTKRKGQDGRTTDTKNIGKGKPESEGAGEEVQQPDTGTVQRDDQEDAQNPTDIGSCAVGGPTSTATPEPPAADVTKAPKALGQLVRSLDDMGVAWENMTLQEIRDLFSGDLAEPKSLEGRKAFFDKAMESLARSITAAHRRAAELCWPHLDERLDTLLSQLRTAAGTVRASKPAELCVYWVDRGQNGQGKCKPCGGSGLLTAVQAQSAPATTLTGNT